jgi:hypothetical protein
MTTRAALAGIAIFAWTLTGAWAASAGTAGAAPTKSTLPTNSLKQTADPFTVVVPESKGVPVYKGETFFTREGQGNAKQIRITSPVHMKWLLGWTFACTAGKDPHDFAVAVRDSGGGMPSTAPAVGG